jgi:hypothetical protein
VVRQESHETKILCKQSRNAALKFLYLLNKFCSALLRWAKPLLLMIANDIPYPLDQVWEAVQRR